MILHNATVDTILERRSVRSYVPQQITQDELETILEAGRFAPSGMNQQSAIAVAMPLPMPAPVPTRGFPRRKKWSSC